MNLETLKLARIISVIALTIFIYSTTEAQVSLASTKPNVILIYADDLGYGDLSCYGATKVHTPNIDKLAREGRMFTDAHSASAVCTPSRYALLTGEYPFRQGKKGSWSPIDHTNRLIIDIDKLTLGQLFKDAGYVTSVIGKWHLGFGNGKCDFNKPLRPGPLELGFQYFFGLSSNNSSNPYVYIENDRVFGWEAKDPLLRLEQPGPPPYPDEEVGKMQKNDYFGASKAHALYDNRMTGTIFSGMAVNWIKKNKNQPFFMYYAPPQIHHPFTPHPRFVGTSECGMYGDFIHELDWMVGEVIRTLDELELTEKTLVIFTSDNGGMYNMGGKAAWTAGHKQNGNLLGFKFGVWEGGHRVPFIARWPGHIEAGSKSDHLISSMDLLSTMAALLDRKLKPEDGLDSFNQMETLTGKPEDPVRDCLILSPREEKNIGLRKDNWVYIGARGDGSRGLGSNKRGGSYAIANTMSKNSDVATNGEIRTDAPQEQLYNLKEDFSQTTNIVIDHPKVKEDLKRQLEVYRNQSRTRF